MSNDIFFAWGDGGQFLFVIPHLNMVVVTTAGNYGENDIMGIALLRDFILQSVKFQYP